MWVQLYGLGGNQESKWSLMKAYLALALATASLTLTTYVASPIDCAKTTNPTQNGPF